MADETRIVKAGSKDVVPTERAQDATAIIRETLGELERMLDARSVIGEPMTFGTTTVIPLLSMGFGFGAGSGGGGGVSPTGDRGEGGGGGGGGGGGVKPVAVLIIDAEGVRLEAIPEPPSGIDKLSGAIAGAIQKRGDKNAKSD